MTATISGSSESPRGIREAPADAHAPRLEWERIELAVGGLSCAGAAAPLARRIERLPGVREALVNPITERAVVVFDPGVIGVEELVDAIEGQEGVEVGRSVARWHLQVDGLHCASCADRIERAVARVPGVRGATVNPAVDSLTIEYAPRRTDLAVVRAVVAAEGGILAAPRVSRVRVIAQEPYESPYVRESRTRRWNLVLAAAVAVVAILVSHPATFAVDGRVVVGTEGLRWLQGAVGLLVLGVMMYPGARFYRGFASSLRHHAADMNTLIVLGVTAAWVYSSFVVLRPALLGLPAGAGVYYDVSAVVIVLALLGETIETSTVCAPDALSTLLAAQPQTSRVVRDGVTRLVPCEELVAGDVAQVDPGEIIPVDGEVIDGETTVDETPVTGTVSAIPKRVGDAVLAATRNGAGVIRVRAVRVGKDTTLSQMIRMIEAAHGSKAPFQRGLDVIAGAFTPGVIVLALLSFMVWFSIGPTPTAVDAALVLITVLVAAAPHAFRLAASTPLLAGIGNGAGRGILIRSGRIVERAHRLDTIVLDGRVAPAPSAESALRHLGLEVVQFDGGDEAKAEWVRRAQDAGKRVAVVGDGVRDALALGQADVGIAVVAPHDLTIAGAGITIIAGGLSGVVTALRLCRATMRTIRQNVAGASVYNAVAVTIGAGALYPVLGAPVAPLLAACGAAASTAVVLWNANRLRRVAVGGVRQ